MFVPPVTVRRALAPLAPSVAFVVVKLIVAPLDRESEPTVRSYEAPVTGRPEKAMLAMPPSSVRLGKDWVTCVLARMFVVKPPPRRVSGAEPSRSVRPNRPVLSSVSVAWLTPMAEVPARVAESRSVRPPPRTVVAPVKLFSERTVSVPVPAFWKAIVPASVPPKVVLVPVVETSVPPEAVPSTLPVPGSWPIDVIRSTSCVVPARSSVPALA